MKKIICPQCKGIGYIFPAFPHKVLSNEEIEFFKCDMCNGEKNVSRKHLQWIKIGQKLETKRISKRLTLKRASIEAKIDPIILSKMERGCIKPDVSILKMY
jgi:hypothetical protein